MLVDEIHSGLAHTTDEALDQALATLRVRLPQQPAAVNESVAAAARRLATFGKRHGLSLGGLTIKELTTVATSANRLRPSRLAFAAIAQVLDAVFLLPIHPSGNGHEKKSERVQRRRHRFAD